jgi:hypothetical protein
LKRYFAADKQQAPRQMSFIENCAHNVDKRLEKKFLKTKNNPTMPIFTNILRRMTQKYTPEQITKILNCITYERYFGNFGNMILKLVFQPAIIKPFLHIKWFLSPAQVHDALHTMFILITQYNLDHKHRDYYGYTMAESIFLIIDERAPAHIVSIGKSFYYLLKHGPKIVLKQQVYVKAWYTRRKTAVRTLEDWWFEIVNSPYTNVGKRTINKLAQNWYAQITPHRVALPSPS